MMFAENVLGISEAGTVAIVVATLGALGLVVPAALNGWVQMSKLNRKVDDLHSAMNTNHGKRPGEYLEMVAEIATRQAHMVEGVAHMSERQVAMAKNIGHITDALNEHTVQDERRFAEIQQSIHELETATLAGNAEAREHRTHL